MTMIVFLPNIKRSNTYPSGWRCCGLGFRLLSLLFLHHRVRDLAQLDARIANLSQQIAAVPRS